MRCLERKTRQHNTTERQSNTTQLTQGSYFSKKKLPRVGFEPTTIRLLGVALSVHVHVRLIPSQLAGEKSFSLSLHRNTCELTENEDMYCTFIRPMRIMLRNLPIFLFFYSSKIYPFFFLFILLFFLFFFLKLTYNDKKTNLTPVIILQHDRNLYIVFKR